MKKILIKIIVYVFFFLGGVLFFYLFNTITTKSNIDKIYSILPEIYFFKPINTNTESLFLKRHYSTVIIHFRPDCEYCQYEARAIRDSLHRFAATNVLLVSDEPIERLQDFAAEYDLANQPNIHILYDRDRKFKDLFGTSMVPSIFIYNQEQKLVKQFKGETKIEAILKYL